MYARKQRLQRCVLCEATSPPAKLSRTLCWAGFLWLFINIRKFRRDRVKMSQVRQSSNRNSKKFQQKLYDTSSKTKTFHAKIIRRMLIWILLQWMRRDLEVSPSMWTSSRERMSGRGGRMKEAPRRRIMVTSSLNTISMDQLEKGVGGQIFT